MKYVIGLCLVMIPLYPRDYAQPEAEVLTSESFPKSPFDAVKVGLEKKIAVASNSVEREKYEAELAIVNKKIKRFRKEWLQFKAQQQLSVKG